jgi:deoxyribodipyrimidine photolyase
MQYDKKKKHNTLYSIYVSANQSKAMKEISQKYGYTNYRTFIDDIVHANLNKNRINMRKVVDAFEQGKTNVPIQISNRNYKVLTSYCTAIGQNPSWVLHQIIDETVKKINKLTKKEFKNEDTNKSD